MDTLFCADTVLVNGKICTVDRGDSIVEAVAVKNGNFLALGTTGRIMGLVGGKTEVIDLAGKLADLVVIDTDILTAPAEALLKTRVLLTMVDGRIVFERREGGEK